MADDKLTEKKDKNVNEPVQFYSSKARQPYEIVVNQVQKDLIVGLPGDAEGTGGAIGEQASVARLDRLPIGPQVANLPHRCRTSVCGGGLRPANSRRRLQFR